MFISITVISILSDIYAFTHICVHKYSTSRARYVSAPIDFNNSDWCGAEKTRQLSLDVILLHNEAYTW